MVWESKAARKVDDLLESFMGIRDLELGIYIYTVTVESYFGGNISPPCRLCCF